MKPTYLCIALLATTLSSCSQTIDSCDDLAGTITHTVTQITGIEAASVFTRNSSSNALEAIDQFNGSEFSNLVINLNLSWIEEQHRFRTPNTTTQSWLDWFVAPAMACSLVPFEDYYEPSVSRIEIYSDGDLNNDFLAGSNLAGAFTDPSVISDNMTLFDASENGVLLSNRLYSLVPAWSNGALAAAPETPAIHIFTIMVALSDGHTFEIRTPEVLISGS